MVSMAVLQLADSDTKFGVLTARQETLNQRIVVSSLRLASDQSDAIERRSLGAMINELEDTHQLSLIHI